MRRTLAAATWLLVAQMALDGAEGRKHPRLDIQDRQLRDAVSQIVAGATRRLTDPKCEQVLNDFSDVGGRPLLENLNAMGLSAAQYLEAISLVDGSDEPRCQPGVAAFTRPYSRRVSICRRAFLDPRPTKRIWLEMIVIHELLHSLGLGENGRHPSSAAITRRVTLRCSG
jgi:hypothetical protein